MIKNYLERPFLKCLDIEKLLDELGIDYDIYMDKHCKEPLSDVKHQLWIKGFEAGQVFIKVADIIHPVSVQMPIYYSSSDSRALQRAQVKNINRIQRKTDERKLECVRARNKLVTKENKAELLSKIDLLHVVSKHIPAVQIGDEFRFKCPFHEGKRALPFLIKKGDVQYRCEECNRKGDAIDFMMQFNRVPFFDAVDRLTETFNLEPMYQVKEKCTNVFVPI